MDEQNPLSRRFHHGFCRGLLMAKSKARPKRGKSELVLAEERNARRMYYVRIITVLELPHMILSCSRDYFRDSVGNRTAWVPIFFWSP